jgi:MFS family permease
VTTGAGAHPDALDEPLPQTDRFPGWRVVFASFMCLTVTSGFAFYGLAVFLTVLSREQGWSVGSISAAVTLFFVVSGVSGLLVARLMVSRDVRVVITIGAVVGAVALLLLGHVSEVWHVYGVYVLLSIGHTFAGLVPATTVVTRWFHARRSVALSVASTGLSVGGIVVTPVAKWLLDRNGLADTAPWLALAWLVGIVPTTLWLMRSDPAALGWRPDGVRTSSAAPAAIVSTPFAAAIRSRFFLTITVGYALILTAQVGGIQQLVKLVEDRSSATAATVATTVLAAASVLARLAGGQAAARTSMAKLAIASGLLQGCALIVIAVAGVLPVLFVGIALFGATVGNLLMLHPLLIGERFGPADYARIFSRSQFVVFLGTASGPYVLGLLHDVTDGYLVAYLVAGSLSLCGSLVLPRSSKRTDGEPAIE